MMRNIENVNGEQRSGQQKQNMAMTSLLITEQSTLESRYTQTPGVHYLRASNRKRVLILAIITCLCIFRYIFYLFLFTFIYSYLFLYISIFFFHTFSYFFLYQINLYLDTLIHFMYLLIRYLCIKVYIYTLLIIY